MRVAGPSALYQACLDNGEIAFDSSQSRAVDCLQQLYGELHEVGKTSFLHRFLKLRKPPAIRGLYLWGGVGRGKTFLMDLFFEQISFDRKIRVHFHRFMRRVHHDLKSLQGQVNPLSLIAEHIADEARIICFDEFFVSDITDAMILAGLFEGLFHRGVVLVATSNVEPDRLYEDGLQRVKFVPAIELINKHTQVINVDGGVDYRLRVLERAEIYHYPLGEPADQSLTSSFTAIAPGKGEADIDLEIEGRSIRARFCADGVAWFEFDQLCDGPRSQNDYIELARIYQTILLSNVPQLDHQKENQARRFISLVDEFYDRNVKLIISAEVPIDELYVGKQLNFGFRRTISRLREMQSHEYLARKHLA